MEATLVLPTLPFGEGRLGTAPYHLPILLVSPDLVARNIHTPRHLTVGRMAVRPSRCDFWNHTAELTCQGAATSANIRTMRILEAALELLASAQHRDSGWRRWPHSSWLQSHACHTSTGNNTDAPHSASWHLPNQHLACSSCCRGNRLLPGQAMKKKPQKWLQPHPHALLLRKVRGEARMRKEGRTWRQLQRRFCDPQHLRALPSLCRLCANFGPTNFVLQALSSALSSQRSLHNYAAGVTISPFYYRWGNQGWHEYSALMPNGCRDRVKVCWL